MLGKLPRWFSWKRLGAAGLLTAFLAGIGASLGVAALDPSGGVAAVVPASLGLVVAAGLAWVLRRREDLTTPEARRADFLSRHAPAPDDVVCHFQDAYGIDLASVLVDRAADRIVFERCHAPRRWPLTWNERRHACAVSDVEAIVAPRRRLHDPPNGMLPLIVITRDGRATIPADADGIAGLVAFLESRVDSRRRPAVDQPDTMNAVVGGAIAGMAAGPAIGLSLWPGLSESAFAWWFLGGTVAGAVITRTILDLLDRRLGIDLAGPIGGAVKGATVALQGAVSLSLLAASAGADWAWVWIPPVAAAVGAIVGAVAARRPTGTPQESAVATIASLEERLDRLAGGSDDRSGSTALRACLLAQWERRRADPPAYVGDLLHALVHGAHAEGRVGAWRPEVEVSEGEVRVCCGWTRVGPHGSTSPPEPDGPTATRTLLRAIADFAAILRESPEPPHRLVVEFAPPGAAVSFGLRTPPDAETCRHVGFDGDGRLVVPIREMPRSTAKEPLEPLAEVLRVESREAEGIDQSPPAQRIME